MFKMGKIPYWHVQKCGSFSWREWIQKEILDVHNLRFKFSN
ncbi:hypothetical protein ABOONEI_2504 [Aciduliprofundum boonei T469]|nr:hypothetical protein ABOONEI_2504 [Aciduliprofundum boonei T469]